MAPPRSVHEEPILIELPEPWRCPIVAWLPRSATRSMPALLEMARLGVRSTCAPALAQRVHEMQDRGAVTVARLPPSALRLDLLRMMSRDWDPAIGREGQLLEIVVAGVLDRRLMPLWASIATARALARTLDGHVIDCGWPRLLPDDLVARVLPEAPRFLVREQVLVVSGPSIEGGPLGSIATLGLDRLGLPELDCRDLPMAVLPGFGAVMNAVATRLLDAALDARATPFSTRRHAALPRVIELALADVAASLGEPIPAPLARRASRTVAVGLRLRDDVRTGPVLAVGPPPDLVMHRSAWAREAARALAWKSPGPRTPRAHG